MQDIDEKQHMRDTLMIQFVHQHQQKQMDILCIVVARSEFIAPWMIMYVWCAFKRTCSENHVILFYFSCSATAASTKPPLNSTQHGWDLKILSAEASFAISALRITQHPNANIRSLESHINGIFWAITENGDTIFVCHWKSVSLRQKKENRKAS